MFHKNTKHLLMSKLMDLIPYGLKKWTKHPWQALWWCFGQHDDD
jgi:hypothetical protein